MQRLDVDGTTLAYEVHGTGPPILLVHGTAARLWGGLVAALEPLGRVVEYDRRSFGASAGPTPPSLATHREDAAALLRAIAGEPAVVVGWSMGGVISLDLAVAHPDLVRGLVLIEPPLHLKRHPAPRMLRAIAGAAVLSRVGDDWAGARVFGSWALGRRDGPGDLARLPPEWVAVLRANATAIVGELRLGTGEHVREADLGRVRAPTVVLQGAESDVLYERAAQRIARAVPGATLRVVDGTGHLLHADRPGVVAEAVRAAASAP
ncbi:MAG: alpha/beta hydrolase [Solirubrobacterales bacterium]|nr:alpha/beta hydrolase [Solirubrobacterales bacterium]